MVNERIWHLSETTYWARWLIQIKEIKIYATTHVANSGMQAFVLMVREKPKN